MTGSERGLRRQDRDGWTLDACPARRRVGSASAPLQSSMPIPSRNAGFTRHASSLSCKAIIEFRACPIGQDPLDVRVVEGQGGRVSVWLSSGISRGKGIRPRFDILEHHGDGERTNRRRLSFVNHVAKLGVRSRQARAGMDQHLQCFEKAGY